MANMNIETSGVFAGTLLEDMSETVSKTGYAAIDVLVEKFWGKDDPHPLTKVLTTTTLPLRKGDVVLVKFTQDSVLYPYLYYIPNSIYSPAAFEFPKDGALVAFPKFTDDENKATSFQILGETTCLWSTDVYTILKATDHFVAITNKGLYIYAKSGYNLLVNDDINIETSKKLNVKITGQAALDCSDKVTLKATEVNINNGHLVVT